MVDSPSKSAAFGVSGFKKATSPLTERFEGASVSILGNLFTNLVKKGNSVEKLVLNPKMVLFTDS